MLQTADIQTGQNTGRFIVVQMTEPSADTLFQTVGVVAVHQHFKIVVALQNQRIAPAQGLLDMRGAASSVGQYAQPACAVAENELHRLGGIVRNRIGYDFEIADRESLPGIDFPDIGYAGKGVFLGAQRAMRQPYRQIVLACQPRDSADMIAMLMGHDDAAQLPGGHVQAGHAPDRVLQAEAAVHQNFCLAGRGDFRPDCNHHRIAFAAAAQGCKTHGHQHIAVTAAD